jgi:hypothetical protein
MEKQWISTVLSYWRLIVFAIRRNFNRNLKFFSTPNQLKYSSLFDEFDCKLGFFWYAWAILKRSFHSRFKGPRVPKKAQFTHERVEYNVFLFNA